MSTVILIHGLVSCRCHFFGQRKRHNLPGPRGIQTVNGQRCPKNHGQIHHAINGKITISYGIITVFNGKITIFNGIIGIITVFNGKTHYFDWVMFNSYVTNYQRLFVLEFFGLGLLDAGFCRCFWCSIFSGVWIFWVYPWGILSHRSPHHFGRNADRWNMLELFLPRCEYKHQEVIDSQRIDYGIEEI